MPPRRNRNRERSAGQSSGSLSRWKLAALSVLAVVLISYLAFAQGAFSTLSASRGAEVGAASGSNALVGIEPAETILVDESSQTSGGCGIGPLVVTQGDSNTLYTVSGGQAQQYGTKGTQVQAIGPSRADLDVPDNGRNEIPYITTGQGNAKLRVLDTRGQSQVVLSDPKFKGGSLPTQKTLLGVGKFNSSDEDEEGESEEEEEDEEEEEESEEEEEEESEGENDSEIPDEQTLVEVTNNLNTPADIKISLVNDVESELIIDGAEAGESYTIAALAPDEQTVVNITSPEEADPGTVRFRIVATSTEDGTTITTNREVDIVSSGGEDSESAPANSNVESYIFFVDANHEGIYKITHGSDPKLIAKPENGAQGIAGIADIDADGTTELIFGDGSQQVRYLEPTGQTSAIPNGQAGSNNGIRLGCPTDFDGDGYPSVPLVTGSNNIKIVNGYEGQKALIKKGVNARKSPITTRDIDNDGSIEIIYISSNGDLKYIDSPLSGPSVKPVDGSIQPNGATGAT